jgi:hypothetical protein
MAAAEVSRSIEIQACAKIASELTAVTKPTTIENAIKDFEEAFDAVVKIVVKKISGQTVPEGEPWGDAPVVGGRNIPVRKSQDEIKQELDNARVGTAVSAGMKASAQSVNRQSSPGAVGKVTVVGEQHGELPSWLVRNETKAGVVKVYDNRSTATPENKRPLFVSADDQRVPFWKPKGVTSEDVGLVF